MYFVMSDIHGEYRDFIKALELFNPNEHQFVFLGDAIDRGEDSLSVIRKLKELKEKHNDAILLFGNHDMEFLKWLQTGEKANFYYWKYFDETVRSFVKPLIKKGIASPKDHIEEAALINQYYQEEIQFMHTWRYYEETQNIIFVHAGYNLELKDWRDSKQEDWLWMREKFIYSSKPTPKKTFFGHTPTQKIRKDITNNHIWISPDNMRIAVDGGCVFGGQLNVLLVDEAGDIKETYAIQTNWLGKTKMINTTPQLVSI